MKWRDSNQPSRFIVKFLFLCAGLLFLFGPAIPKGASAEIRLAGSSTILPIIKRAAPLFEHKTGIKVVYQGGGSGAGVRKLLNGAISIGLVSRSLHPEEARHLKAYTIGMDGIAVIVHATNPFAEIDHRQVAAVFSGEWRRWSDLGGVHREIQLVAKKAGRSTKELFESHFSLEGRVDKRAHLIGSNAEAIMFVAGDPYAIGYVSVGTAEAARDRDIPIKLLGLDGVGASIGNVRDGSYPLTRPLNLVVRGEPATQTTRFIEFMQGPEGAELVALEQFIPVPAQTVDIPHEPAQ